MSAPRTTGMSRDGTITVTLVILCQLIHGISFSAMPLLLLVIAVNSIFLQFYFGPLFLVPLEVLGSRIAGTATGFSNLFANIGGFLTAYALGAVKDQTGSFTWGFVGISVICLTGVVLAMVLAGMRAKALSGD